MFANRSQFAGILRKSGVRWKFSIEVNPGRLQVQLGEMKRLLWKARPVWDPERGDSGAGARKRRC